MISIGELDFKIPPLLPKEGIEGWFKQFIFIFHTFCKVKFRSNHPRPLLDKEGSVPNPTYIFSYLNKTPV